jgi:Rad52/22 family double-strand break repair protein
MSEIDFVSLPKRIQQRLEIFPAKKDYKMLGTKPYLPIEYYYEQANSIFGIGNWSVSCVDKPVFEKRCHPITDQFVGEICLVTVTLLVRDCLPITQTRSVAVVYAKKENSTELKDYQDISHTDNAINKATARAVKACFAQLGNIFQNDYEGKKEAEWDKRHNQVTQTPNSNKTVATKAVSNPVAVAPTGTIQIPKAEANLKQADIPSPAVLLVNPSVKEVTFTSTQPIAADSPEISEPDPWAVQSKETGEAGQVVLISDTQKQRLQTLLGKKGRSMNSLEKTIRQRYNHATLTWLELTKEQAQEIIAALEKLPDKPPEAETSAA